MIWDQRVTTIPGVGPKRGQLLEEMGIRTVGDLALTLPFRYLDASAVTPIAHLLPNEFVTIHVRVVSSRLIRTRSRQEIVVAAVADDSGKMNLTFFHQPYIVKKLGEGEMVALTGKTTVYQNKLTIINPTVENLAGGNQIHTGRIVPIYRQHETLRSTWLRQTLFTLLQAALPEVPEPLPENILAEEGLLPLREALWQAHFPDSAPQADQARRRLAFAELWDIFAQLRQQDEANRRQSAAAALPPGFLKRFWPEFAAALPVELTASQISACHDLSRVLSQPHPSFHLVQGEVGSGKTFVAAFALAAIAATGAQALYLAPTAILAQQHSAAIGPIAKKLGLETALWTANEKTKPQAPILIGTHALILDPDRFRPGLVVVDEEHRFGVRQRARYWEREPKPHLLSLTATPIPRTLAHAVYGDQAVSYLELIPGKEKRTLTRAFPPERLERHFRWLAQQAQTGAQAFLIAPFISPSEAEGFAEVYDAESLFARAKAQLPGLRLALLTGDTKPKDKQQTLKKMLAREIDVLVATPVVEVGIDIPNASLITIFSAERFGLAQLHQLRGRVGRAGQESWCFLVPSPGVPVSDRLKKLETIHSGNQLAELDLKNRGVGEFLGTRQSGWDTLRTADWLDLKLIEQVKRVLLKVGP